MNDRPQTPLLDRVDVPADLRKLAPDQLRQLADELRLEVIDAVSVTGGHLGAGLGVVELSIALHHVFDTPQDKIIWDVGHQGYPHKMLTGRRARMKTLRQPDGIFERAAPGSATSSFFKRTHCSTISAASTTRW